MTLRIAMWSGPRNISTAMMRSFSSRTDTYVSDEPFYGAFLEETGLNHPMADEIKAAMETDWHKVAEAMSGDPPDGSPVWYQKQMNHHMVGPVQPDDLEGVRHAFLIRDPVRIVASYSEKMEEVTPEGLGLAAQRQFFDRLCDRIGYAPPVVDSDSVLRNPERTLSMLCSELGIEWDEAMLSWPKGQHPQDGVWAPHWYNRVIETTGFAKPSNKPPPELPLAHQRIADAFMDDYCHLKAHAL